MNEAEYLMKNYGDRPSSCLLAVLAMFLAIFSPSSYS